jgi:hypothetical protein
MKAITRLAAACAAFCLLGACATSQEQASYVPLEKVPAPGSVVTDSAYVAAVERTARRRGIDVQWVNVPTRRQPQK